MFTVHRLLFAASALCISQVAVAQNATCCSPKPPIRPIDKTCLPAGKSPCNLPLYRGDILAKYQQVAYIDSFISLDNCSDTVQKQLKDVQAKGKAAGADALIRVRVLKNRVRGWHEDPHTPFKSVHQDASDDYFIRATAIKYIEWPDGEPEAIAVTQSAPRSSAPKSAFGMGSMFKQRRTRREQRMDEITVPEMQATNPFGGVQ